MRGKSLSIVVWVLYDYEEEDDTNEDIDESYLLQYFQI